MIAKKSQNNFGSASSSGDSNTTITTATTPTRQRIRQNYLLFWVDANIDQTNKDCQNTLTQLRAVVNDVTMCTRPDECIEILDKLNDKKVFVITSGSLGQHLVFNIHDLSKLNTIYIFCDNISYHQEWIKDWKKIKGVYNNIKDICDALKAGVKQINQDSIPISFVTMNEAVSSENLNQLEPNYMYTQIFKEILLEMEHDHNQAVKVLSLYSRKFYQDNIDEFEHNYRQEKAIWWYTRGCFTSEMLNRALRTLDADTIINMGFFINDLHEQINQLHKQQLPNYHGEPLVVYRGQGLSNTDFDKLKKTKGGLMSFDSFLSTTNDRNVSFMYADSASVNPNTVGILFIMTIDPRVSSTPFASVKEVSYYKTEEEILFSMHAVFRINEIKEMGDNHKLYEVKLKVTADDDEQLRQLTGCISKEVGGDTGWERLGNLLLKTGHFDKAEELYEVLLEQPSSQSDKAHYYHQLGYTKNYQGDYEQAIEYHRKALEIRRKTLPINHPSLSTSYSNIGFVYSNMGEYSKALSFYKTAFEIEEKALPANHSSLAMSQGNIGGVYYSMGAYSKAISFYEKALEIQKKTLPANHPSLATSYSNIGAAYTQMGEYSESLSFFEEGRKIFEKTLSANHPSLAACYSNIGNVYNNMGEYSKALSFHEKAVGVREKTLSANHPDLATSYNNIGNVYYKMREYSKALSSFEKAVGIQEKTLPANHPLLASSYCNIGTVHSSMGEYSKALSFHVRTLVIGKKALPANHPLLVTSYNSLGGLYYNMKKYSKALLYFERALDILKVSSPPNHFQLKSVKASIKIVKQKL
ncbi:unnamed protein product [Adineta steineri]|uniref:ADP ribosyltransferase domain-containing protein n=1 Tax=Adineta steineri TaxID=433720 RepID=A0A819CUR9_9BILA|nr:unnamed protein product [Adineta steineri]CAF3821976.1 unnamed protein product [Adineta steineri]